MHDSLVDRRAQRVGKNVVSHLVSLECGLSVVCSDVVFGDGIQFFQRNPYLDVSSDLGKRSPDEVGTFAQAFNFALTFYVNHEGTTDSIPKVGQPPHEKTTNQVKAL
jgi:hypothetical protein